MRETITTSLQARFNPKHKDRLQQYIRRLTRPAWLGTIRRTTPLSQAWGWDRGTPVDRYYIEQFIEMHQQDIHGRVLEIRDSRYTNRYGNRVEQSDVLDINPEFSPGATIIADLASCDLIPSDLFDCFILTQTLQLIYDLRAAVAHSNRILRPGGVLLATLPTMSPMSRRRKYKDYWRFTADSCASLFTEAFGEDQVTIVTYGNVLTAITYLMGMAHEELSRRELDTTDPHCPLIVAVRAVKRHGNH